MQVRYFSSHCFQKFQPLCTSLYLGSAARVGSLCTDSPALALAAEAGAAAVHDVILGRAAPHEEPSSAGPGPGRGGEAEEEEEEEGAGWRRRWVARAR